MAGGDMYWEMGSTTTQLTEKQRACIRGVLDLKSAKEIARDLGLSHHSVEKHLKAVRKKLGARDTAEAARIFAAQERGTESPYYRLSDVQAVRSNALRPERPGHDYDDIHRLSRDPAFETRGAAYGHGSLKTIGLIILASLAMVAVLALLVAIAEGVKLLTS